MRLVSACGVLDESAVLAELETGRARAVADLGRDDLPLLGTPTDPYVIFLTPNLGKPGQPNLPPCANAKLGVSNATACTRDTPLSTGRRWSMMIGRCDALAALDHEGPGGHSGCLLYRPLVGLPASLEACLNADHPAGKGMRFDVAGRLVPIRPKLEPKPEPPPVPEPAVKLNKRQAAILSRFPATGWVTATEVGAEEAILKRMERRGVLERKGKLYRRRP